MTPEQRRKSRSEHMKRLFRDPVFLIAHKERSRCRMVEANKTEPFIKNRIATLAKNNSPSGIAKRVAKQWPLGAVKARKRLVPKWVPKDLRIDYLDNLALYGVAGAAYRVRSLQNGL